MHSTFPAIDLDRVSAKLGRMSHNPSGPRCSGVEGSIYAGRRGDQQRIKCAEEKEEMDAGSIMLHAAQLMVVTKMPSKACKANNFFEVLKPVSSVQQETSQKYEKQCDHVERENDSRYA